MATCLVRSGAEKSREDTGGVDPVDERALGKPRGVDPAESRDVEILQLADRARSARVRVHHQGDPADLVAPFELLERAVVEAGDLDGNVAPPRRDGLPPFAPLLHLLPHRDDLVAFRHAIDELEGRRIGEDTEVAVPARARLDREVLVALVDEDRVSAIGELEQDRRVPSQRLRKDHRRAGVFVGRLLDQRDRLPGGRLGRHRLRAPLAGGRLGPAALRHRLWQQLKGRRADAQLAEQMNRQDPQPWREHPKAYGRLALDVGVALHRGLDLVVHGQDLARGRAAAPGVRVTAMARVPDPTLTERGREEDRLLVAEAAAQSEGLRAPRIDRGESGRDFSTLEQRKEDTAPRPGSAEQVCEQPRLEIEPEILALALEPALADLGRMRIGGPSRGGGPGRRCASGASCPGRRPRRQSLDLLRGVVGKQQDELFERIVEHFELVAVADEMGELPALGRRRGREPESPTPDEHGAHGAAGHRRQEVKGPLLELEAEGIAHQDDPLGRHHPPVRPSGAQRRIDGIDGAQRRIGGIDRAQRRISRIPREGDRLPAQAQSQPPKPDRDRQPTRSRTVPSLPHGFLPLRKPSILP